MTPEERAVDALKRIGAAYEPADIEIVAAAIREAVDAAIKRFRAAVAAFEGEGSHGRRERDCGTAAARGVDREGRGR